MKDTEILNPVGEAARMAACVLEPLRRPGAVQPHGVVFVLDTKGGVIREVSDNVQLVTGIPLLGALGQPLSDVLGDVTASALQDVADQVAGAINPVPVDIHRRGFDGIAHRAGDTVIVELEPATPGVGIQATSAVFAAVHRLAKTSTPEQVWAATAVTVRELTGFDRVMVYHFHTDGHGQVVAEQAHPDMDPYLGLHYPASDIPTQARELYLSKLSRAIVASAENGAALVREDGPDAAHSVVDLGMAELRSVSPHHLQFMRNMGQASTLSFSLVHEGALIGMITCAHRTSHRVPYLIRQGLEVLANQVALQLSSMAEIEHLRQQAGYRQIRDSLVARLESRTDVADALLHGETTLLTLIPADGVAVVADGRATSLGDVPGEAGIHGLHTILRELTVGRTLTSEALAAEHSGLAALLPDVAGMLVVPLGGADDFLVWFRHEVTQKVKWLGDMGADNRATPLSPRNSFSSWTQSVSGRSLPWQGLEREARELSRDLDGFFLRKAESRLADLARIDTLTGLPNRRLFTDRLEHGLTKYARGEELSLLFLDLDDFKAINDRFGHAVGDQLLVHVAEVLQRATRDQDTVARLGGDEFVVLCENTTAEEADIVAARISEALRQPVTLSGHELHVTGSIGVAAANLTFGGGELLRQADEAMYRAKQRGRGRIAR